MDLEKKFNNFSIEQLYSRLEKTNNYFVDIGASDGPGPIFSYLTDISNSGLCIEGRPYLYDSLKNNINNSNVDIHIGFIYPHTINDIFKKYNVPKEPDILKIDIDSYDLEILRNILDKYKPKIIIAEINEKIPPPVYFEVKYAESYEYDSSHFFGFSIQAGKEVLESYGYKIVSLIEGNNIICLHTDYFEVPNIDINTIYRLGYLENSEIFNKFYWNDDVNHWHEIDDVEMLKKYIIGYFTQNNFRGTPKLRDSFIIK